MTDQAPPPKEEQHDPTDAPIEIGITSDVFAPALKAGLDGKRRTTRRPKIVRSPRQ
jgi:hypothetical protein